MENGIVMDDRTLLNDCLNGSSIAQKKLFEKYAPKMMYVCLRYCREREDAEDALQEAFIKVFNSLSKYQYEGSFEGWIRKIVVNCCLDLIRRNKHHEDQTNLDSVDFKITSAGLASDDLQAEDLMKVIQSMPRGYQLVFNMFAIEGYTHKEIAEMLAISEETSKSQYFRARAFLKNYLEKTELGR